MSKAPPAATPVTAALRQLAAESPLRVRVAGDCMRPLMRDGDTIEVVRDRFPLPGDVIAFQGAGGGRLVHRLVGYRLSHWRLFFQTRADANGRLDSPIPSSLVIGRVTRAQGPIVVSWSDRLRWLLWRFSSHLYDAARH